MKKIEARKNGTKRVFTVNTEPSKTDQSQKEASDVNNIMAQYLKTGQLTHIAKNIGVFADVSEIKDLQESIDTVNLANQAMMALPAELRNRLNNDPQEFIEWINDDKNNEEAISFGLKSPILLDTQPITQSSSQKSKKPKNNDDDLNDDDKTQSQTN